MVGKNRREEPPELAQGRERLAAWRRMTKPKSRIPERLWKLAVKLAAKHGLHRTAQTLKLDYYSLKKRLETATATTKSATAGRGEEHPAFIDLPPALSPVPESGRESVQECVIEFDDGAVSVRVQLKGYSAAEIATVGRSVRGGE